MQIYFEVAADVAESGAELKDQQRDAERGDEPVVAANDNGLRWPFIPFPDGCEERACREFWDRTLR